MPIPQPPKTDVDEAERKVGAILDELEAKTNSTVKDIGLDDIVDTDRGTGQPVVHQTVDITVQPRPQRKWLR